MSKSKGTENTLSVHVGHGNWERKGEQKPQHRKQDNYTYSIPNLLSPIGKKCITYPFFFDQFYILFFLSKTNLSNANPMTSLDSVGICPHNGGEKADNALQ